MLAKIYKPAKNAMQSGRANLRRWVVEFESESPRRIDPLMGWTSGTDMLSSEVRIPFESKEAAIAYAERHGIPFELYEPEPARRRLQTYAENFRYDKVR